MAHSQSYKSETMSQATPNSASKSLSFRHDVPKQAGDMWSKAFGTSKKASKEPTQKLVVTHTKDWWSFASEFILIGGSLAALGYMFNQLLKHQNPESANKRAAQNIKLDIVAKMKVKTLPPFEFNTKHHETSHPSHPPQ